MAARAIIRMGDSTSHGGTVLEGFPMLNVYGKPASGIGHRGHCPKCKCDFVIVAGAENLTFMGKNIAVEGMQTSCGAVLIATQHEATVDNMPGVNIMIGGSNPAVLQDTPAALAEDEVIEHWYSLEDEAGNPVEGYRYDLYQGEDRLAHKASFNSGKSTVIPGGDSNFVMWLEWDSAKRDVVT